MLGAANNAEGDRESSDHALPLPRRPTHRLSPYQASRPPAAPCHGEILVCELRQTVGLLVREPLNGRQQRCGPVAHTVPHRARQAVLERQDFNIVTWPTRAYAVAARTPFDHDLAGWLLIVVATVVFDEGHAADVHLARHLVQRSPIVTYT